MTTKLITAFALIALFWITLAVVLTSCTKEKSCEGCTRTILTLVNGTIISSKSDKVGCNPGPWLFVDAHLGDDTTFATTLKCPE